MKDPSSRTKKLQLSHILLSGTFTLRYYRSVFHNSHAISGRAGGEMIVMSLRDLPETTPTIDQGLALPQCRSTSGRMMRNFLHLTFLILFRQYPLRDAPPSLAYKTACPSVISSLSSTHPHTSTKYYKSTSNFQNHIPNTFHTHYNIHNGDC